MMKKLSAEFLGTFWLVFGGCGSAVLAAGFPELGIGFVGVSLAFGLTVLTMAYAVGHISGGGAVRPTRTSLSKDSDAVLYAAQRPRHSARAAARFRLKMDRLERLRSVLKWLVTEANVSPPHCERPPQMGKSTRGGGGSSAPPPQSKTI